MIHDVFIMGTNRICWRYCQGEKRVLPRDFAGHLGNRFSVLAFSGQDLTGSKKQYGKDRQNQWTLSEL